MKGTSSETGNSVAMKHISKPWILHRNVSTQWLHCGQFSGEFVLCLHMSAQYDCADRFAGSLVILGIVYVLADISG